MIDKVLSGMITGTAMASYGLWRICKAARRGKTVHRGREIYRNVDPKEFWIITSGDAIIFALGCALVVSRQSWL